MIAPAPSERTWSRVELVSMDGQCADISIALYRQETETGPVGIVHTYSRAAGAEERVVFVASAMRTLVGSLRPATTRRRSPSPAGRGIPRSRGGSFSRPS